LRSYQRRRDDHIEMAAAHVQHMQKAFELLNIKLHHRGGGARDQRRQEHGRAVISSLSGASGLRIVRAILAGERDAPALAALCDERILKTKRARVLLSRQALARPPAPACPFRLLGGVERGASLCPAPGARRLGVLPSADRRMRPRDRAHPGRDGRGASAGGAPVGSSRRRAAPCARARQRQRPADRGTAQQAAGADGRQGPERAPRLERLHAVAADRRSGHRHEPHRKVPRTSPPGCA
jgi:hypothetical protein